MNLKQKLNVFKHKARWLAIKYEFEIVMFSLTVLACIFVGAVR